MCRGRTRGRGGEVSTREIAHAVFMVRPSPSSIERRQKKNEKDILKLKFKINTVYILYFQPTIRNKRKICLKMVQRL